ncbi:DNA adenine methylase, partial [Glaesserella parasuis]|uniref:DNA adenine methylase n=1 Tax=Glaesserella parasuis TaxID=738 RepID=UPI003F3B33A1
SVWRELGDPSGYVEPFAGSAAVLLARPRFDGRRVETINDADGWLINMWRAIQLRPSEVATHCARMRDALTRQETP